MPSAARTATQISTPVLRGARLPSGGCCRVTIPGRSWDSSVTTRPTRRSEASSWTTAAIWFPPTTLGTRIKPPELMTASTVPPVGSFAPAGGLCSRIRPSGVWEGRIDCCPSRRALPSRAVAVSTDSPTRLGTVTNSGAANQTVTTASGGRNPPGSGSCRITVPSGWSERSRPPWRNLRSASRRILCASRTGCPMTLGTRAWWTAARLRARR